MTTDAVRDELELLDRCRSFYLSKSPGRLPDYDDNFTELALDELIQKLRNEGTPPLEIEALAIKTIRLTAYRFLIDTRSAVSERINETEPLYFHRLLRYGKRYGLTANAMSEYEIRDQRRKMLNLNNLEKLTDNTLTATAHWKLKVEEHVRIIHDVSALTGRMSKDILDWSKLIDDKLRLNIALLGFWIGLALNIAKIGYDIYKDTNYPPRAVTTTATKLP